MYRILTILAAGAGLFASLAVPAQAASDVSLARFDCGTPQAPVAVNQRFSDTYAYGDLKLQFVFSCYLVKHGDEYLLWDTGHAMTAPNVAPKVSLVDLPGEDRSQTRADQICRHQPLSRRSHRPDGLLSEGDPADRQKDWEAISSPKPAEGVNFKPFESWIKGESKVEPLIPDKDVFGDGSAIVLATPGHTPGHSQPARQAAADGQCRPERRRCAFPRELRYRTAYPRSTSIAPRRWHRSSASRRSHRISKRPLSFSTMRATSKNCRCFRRSRSSCWFKSQFPGATETRRKHRSPVASR